MKTQGLEARFSQNLVPVGARKATKPLSCLHFTFIQQALNKSGSTEPVMQNYQQLMLVKLV
jgi:hypothetical protein